MFPVVVFFVATLVICLVWFLLLYAVWRGFMRWFDSRYEPKHERRD